MGKYDDIPPENVRVALVRFAELILELEREERLLGSGPELLRILGDLRQMLFAYEVRGTANLPEKRSPKPAEDPLVRESIRVVEEALRRQQELEEELEEPPSWNDPSEDDED